MAGVPEALVAAHARSGAVVTVAVEPRADVTGAIGVVVVGADDRVVGYQLRPDPAEALSDLVDTGVHYVDEEALEYLPAGSEWSSEAIPELLAQDVPVYAFRG
jgi:mannose-1-phosphate guanylyltransferase/mannose-1-phosphate guanylyltransferase/phosphomannomutase